ncbi:MAG TPA: hypothetical protein VGM50_13580 [Gemmatimonadaceae bacterium]|jgi:hypothetical protein
MATPLSGRARIDHLLNHLRAFKTPTLRNIALIAPYMHNGASKTLDEVLDFYDHGGGLGAAIRSVIPPALSVAKELQRMNSGDPSLRSG